MQGILLATLVLTNPDLRQNSLALSEKIDLNSSDFYIGSFELNENNVLVLRHLPKMEGGIMPAIVYLTPVVFKKQSDIKKAKSLVGASVKVLGKIEKMPSGDVMYINNIAKIAE